MVAARADLTFTTRWGGKGQLTSNEE